MEKAMKEAEEQARLAKEKAEAEAQPQQPDQPEQPVAAAEEPAQENKKPAAKKPSATKAHV